MIPEHVMKELRYIEVFTDRKIRNQRVGTYQSPQRGPGFDFDEHQPYRPGDDVRRIDWNVTARMGAPFVRHTHAEREMNVMVAMDVSRSMALGTTTHSKRETMTFITGSILFSALADQINTGFVAFGDKVLLSTQPRRTRAAAWSVLEQAWALKPSASKTLLLPLVRHLSLTLKRMSLIFIVSDFVTSDDVLESPELAHLAHKHDVVAVVPEDRAETELPAGAGYLHMRNLESGRRVSVGLGRQARGRYADAIRERREALSRAFYRVPMDHVFVPTVGSPVLPVLSLFCQEKSVIRRFLQFAIAALIVSGGVHAQTKPAPRNAPAPAAAPPAAAAGPVQVRASVDRTAIWVGDRVTYTVDIVCARGVEILLDDLAKEKLRVNGLDVVSSDTTTTADASERMTYRLRYVLSTYRVDAPSPSIEPMSARYYERRPGQRLQDIAPAGEVQIPGAVIAFRSTLPDQPAYELRDGRAAAPRNPVLSRAGSIGLALVVVSLAPAVFVALALLRRRTRKAGRRSARQARMDHRATLERLRSLDVTTEEERRRAYDEISAAVRQHIAAASGVPAPSLTAAEVGAALETARGRIPRESVTALLASCDDARYGPPHALPSAQACRDALAAAEQVLAGR